MDKVLIVAKCIVNIIKQYICLEKKKVLIVAKCIVNEISKGLYGCIVLY